jgi:hypothetical protein
VKVERWLDTAFGMGKKETYENLVALGMYNVYTKARLGTLFVSACNISFESTSKTEHSSRVSCLEFIINWQYNAIMTMVMKFNNLRTLFNLAIKRM